MKNNPNDPGGGKNRPYQAALTSLIAVHFIISLFLVFRFPKADCALVYLTAMNNVETGNYSLPGDPSPGDPRVAMGRDGLFHSTYEPLIPRLYSLMIRAGHLVDSGFFNDTALWSGWGASVFSAKYALVELPHLLVLPITGSLIFLILSKMGCSLSTSAFISLIGLLSTIIPWSASPITRDGLGLPVTTAAFYFALSGRFEEKGTRRLLLYLAAGAASAAAVLMKITTATIAVPIFFYIVSSEWGRTGNGGRARLVPAVVFAAPVLIAAGLLFLDRYLVFGSAFSGPINTNVEKFSLWIPLYEGLFGLLLSPGKGLFWYNPVLLLVIVSWGAFKRGWRLEAHAFLVHAVCLIIPLAAQSSWAGDEAYGPRYVIGLIPWGLIIAGYWIDSHVKKRTAALWTAVLSAAGILVQLPALLVSLSTAGVAHQWNQKLAFPLKHFWPSLSPVVVFWKALLSRLTDGYLYGESYLFSPTTQYPVPPVVDFAGSFAWRETFFYEVVRLKWNAAAPFLSFAAIASGFFIYRLLKAVKYGK